MMAHFETGATRNSSEGKLDFEGFESSLVLKRYAEYMHKHRKQEDGGYRASDNWQLGIPRDAYMKSGWRHFVDWWSQHRGYKGQDEMEESICALIFNAKGYLHTLLEERNYGKKEGVKEQTCLKTDGVKVWEGTTASVAHDAGCWPKGNRPLDKV